MQHKAFITNTKTRTLKKRLEQLIEHSQELKFLVGFFCFSGWRQSCACFLQRDDLQVDVLGGWGVPHLRLPNPDEPRTKLGVYDRIFQKPNSE